MSIKIQYDSFLNDVMLNLILYIKHDAVFGINQDNKRDENIDKINDF